jgi:hypothetical protein
MPIELNSIVVGAMRFKDRSSAAATIHRAIDNGFNYIDTSPCYCKQSEEENSESWVGAAVRQGDYLDRVQVSTKCSPGNGGLQVGEEFNPSGGFGVRSAEQLRQVFAQSQRRTGLPRFDAYQLWTVHTEEQFAEAMKPGGWYDGACQLRDEGLFRHLGVTTHADTDTVVRFLETGKFEMVTIPLNIVNTTRLGVVEYCVRQGIEVIAMNPLAGGFLAANEELKELALRYLLRLPRTHVLIGFSSPEEVDYAKWILDTMPQCTMTAGDMLRRVDELIDTEDPRCTACGYCRPCPQGINVGASLSYYNLYKYMGITQAKDAFLGKQWEDGLRLDRCTGCLQCQTRCPNNLPLGEILPDAKSVMYGQS